MGRKHIQISAGLKIDASNYYERKEDHKTGKITTINHTHPISGSSSVTITNRPLKVEHDCSSGPNKTEHHSTWTPKIEKETRTSSAETKKDESYDTSALFE